MDVAAAAASSETFQKRMADLETRKQEFDQGRREHQVAFERLIRQKEATDKAARDLATREAELRSREEQLIAAEARLRQEQADLAKAQADAQKREQGLAALTKTIGRLRQLLLETDEGVSK